MKWQKWALCVCGLWLAVAAWAQPSGRSQTVFIELKDKNTEQVIKVARFELLNFSPARIYSQQDSQGLYKLENVPLGRHRLKIEAENYQTLIESDLIVGASAELFLLLKLEQAIDSSKQEVAKEKQLNLQALPLAGMSSLTNVGIANFSLDEVNRFAGSRSDIARLISGQGGVVNSDDARNDIIVRGASPLGIQWRLEGLPVFNPNHFGYLSSTAGYFPIININAMANSEFVLGNFSAEYGNSSAGLFDIRLRAGNKEKVLTTLGLSINGAEMLLEGPLRKGKRSSFLVAGRYSVLRLVSDIIGLNTATVPIYNDLNFKLDFGKTAKTESSLFGFVGYAKAYSDHREIEDGDVSVTETNKDQYNKTVSGFLGWKYKRLFGAKKYMQVAVGSSQALENYYADYYLKTNQNLPAEERYRGRFYSFYNGNLSLSAFMHHQTSRRYSYRNGLLVEGQYFNLYDMYNRFNLGAKTLHDYDGTTAAVGAYHQSRYRFNQKIALNAGLHLLWLTLNNDYAIDPRFSLQYDINLRHRVSFGYALQRQQLPQRLYFYRHLLTDSSGELRVYEESARNLKMWGNHYWVLEYSYRLNGFWQLSVAPYYRSWFNIPVSAGVANGYSLVNHYSDLQFNMPTTALSSAGTATNYGVDVSLQKSFSKGLFLLLSGSWFNSTYAGSDGIVRNSRFNRHWLGRFRLNKEWRVGKEKNSVLFLSSTITTAGGEYYTPIDIETSRRLQAQVLTDEINSLRTPAYFRADVKLGMRINSAKRRLSHYFYLDIMNVSNHKNVLRQQYSLSQDRVIPVYQFGVFPDLLYRMQF